MTARRLWIVGIVLASLCVVALFGSLWYWALFGMDPDVGLAWSFTAIALGVAAGLALSEAGHRS